jgi:transposase
VLLVTLAGWVNRHQQHVIAWLRTERLPAYAPDLNPVEPLWGNVKTRELANHCALDLESLGRPLRAGLARVRRSNTLGLSFLRYAGLTL